MEFVPDLSNVDRVLEGSVIITVTLSFRNPQPNTLEIIQNTLDANLVTVDGTRTLGGFRLVDDGIPIIATFVATTVCKFVIALLVSSTGNTCHIYLRLTL